MDSRITKSQRSVAARARRTHADGGGTGLSVAQGGICRAPRREPCRDPARSQDAQARRNRGLEANQIKSDERMRLVPVVILTSSRESRDLEEAYRLGANAYVVKPVRFTEFVEAIKGIGVFWALINEPAPGSVKGQ